ELIRQKKRTTKIMQAAHFDLTPLNNSQLATWAKTHLKELKTEIEPVALSRVIELVGSDVRTLTNELDKLVTATLPSVTITKKLVDDLVGRSRELLNWELTDQMIARHRPQTLQTFKHF